ncbi:hypothetical protein Patl1_19096 [Pistacia atlantica]|uniref:Uncharacterized protein n=1 Tax=Pistacia atlantica TaxID=434234 RepID=A0ACC1C140_9ROSI|nr:hypothetical protein Patl1_19096 [Pistacia atlantica]
MSIFNQTRTEDYESHSETGDYFKIWPEPTKNPIQESSTGASIFSILIKHTFFYCSELYSSSDDNLNDFDKDDQTIEVERDLLLNNDTLISRFILEDKLMDKDIPSWPSMIDNVLKCARDMAQNKEFEGYKVLHMHARVDTIVDESDELLP